jgi:hypothetical protein
VLRACWEPGPHEYAVNRFSTTSLGSSVLAALYRALLESVVHPGDVPIRGIASREQASKCPPSIAVRQRRMATSTFRCSQVNQPRLCAMNAGPASRMTSANSREGRRMAAGQDAVSRANCGQLVERIREASALRLSSNGLTGNLSRGKREAAQQGWQSRGQAVAARQAIARSQSPRLIVFP